LTYLYMWMDILIHVDLDGLIYPCEQTYLSMWMDIFIIHVDWHLSMWTNIYPCGWPY
jgi:hypothetical protein